MDHFLNASDHPFLSFSRSPDSVHSDMNDSLWSTPIPPSSGSSDTPSTFTKDMVPSNATGNTTTRSGVPMGPMSFPWSNPRNVITQETSENITDALQCYVFPVVTVIGITGNILSLIVLFQKRLRGSTTSIILIALAFSDLVFLVANAVRKSTCIIGRYDQMAADTLNATTFFYMFYLKTGFSRVSTLLVVLISIERLFAVAFPIKKRSVFTIPNVSAAVVMCFVVTLSFLAVLPPQYTYTYIRGKPYISQTDFALNNVEPLKIYNEYFLPICFRHIPVVMVLAFNATIIVILGRNKNFKKPGAKKTVENRSDEQKKITRMLLSVAIIFLICLLPGDALLLASLFNEDFRFFGTYHNLFLALSDICLLFEMINACCNFVVYMVLNKNFYDTYIRLFCCCLRQLRSGEASKSSTTKGETGRSEVSASKFSSAMKGGSVESGIEDDKAVTGSEAPGSLGEQN